MYITFFLRPKDVHDLAEVFIKNYVFVMNSDEKVNGRYIIYSLQSSLQLDT